MRLRSRASAVLAALVFVLLVLAPAGFAAAGAPGHFVLEFEFSNPRGGIAQIYYNVGDGYNGRDLATTNVPASTTLQPLRFTLPAKPVVRIRMDPDTGEAEFRIGRIRLLTDTGAVVKEFGPECLRPMQAIRSISIAEGIATIRTGANDPMLIVDEPLQAESQRALGLRVVPRTVVLALAALAAVFAVVAVLLAVRTVRDRQAVNEAIPAWRYFLGAALVVFGARLAWLSVYADPMPYFDEWDADVLYLLIPLQGGYLDWTALFRAHAEHRLVFTRLITLGGTILNGSWDPRVSMVISAMLSAALFGLLATFAAASVRRLGWIAALVVTGFAVLPYDHANVFWGFQSQMYALALFAVCILAIASGDLEGPLGWIAVAAVSLISLFTMGSGFVAPGIAVVVCLLRAWKGPGQRRRLLLLALLFGLAVATGLVIRSESTWHAPSYSRTLKAFLDAFVRFGSWPLEPKAWALAVVWLPWTVHALVLPFRRRSLAFLDWFSLGLGAWAAINVAGLAHGRPYEQTPLDSRFYTVLSMGGMAAVLSTCALYRALPRRQWLVLPLAACSIATLVSGFSKGVRGIDGAREQLARKQGYAEMLAPFLTTGNSKLMEDGDPAKSPFWNTADLSARINHPLLQPVLPVTFRAALSQRTPAPKLSVSPGPLTAASVAAMKTGLLLGILGTVVWFSTTKAVWSRRRNSADAESRLQVEST